MRIFVFVCFITYKVLSNLIVLLEFPQERFVVANRVAETSY